MERVIPVPDARQAEGDLDGQALLPLDDHLHAVHLPFEVGVDQGPCLVDRRIDGVGGALHAGARRGAQRVDDDTGPGVHPGERADEVVLASDAERELGEHCGTHLLPGRGFFGARLTIKLAIDRGRWGRFPFPKA